MMFDAVNNVSGLLALCPRSHCTISTRTPVTDGFGSRSNERGAKTARVALNKNYANESQRTKIHMGRRDKGMKITAISQSGPKV
jgi:hypothetical protein